jgi:hypothetical protein
MKNATSGWLRVVALISMSDKNTDILYRVLSDPAPHAQATPTTTGAPP